MAQGSNAGRRLTGNTIAVAGVQQEAQEAIEYKESELPDNQVLPEVQLESATTIQSSSGPRNPGGNNSVSRSRREDEFGQFVSGDGYYVPPRRGDVNVADPPNTRSNIPTEHTTIQRSAGSQIRQTTQALSGYGATSVVQQSVNSQQRNIGGQTGQARQEFSGYGTASVDQQSSNSQQFQTNQPVNSSGSTRRRELQDRGGQGYGPTHRVQGGTKDDPYTQ